MTKARRPGSSAAGMSKFIDGVRQRLLAGEGVRRTLPGGGRLHIDRQLPFLVVYRWPPDRADAGTRDLVRGEASYLLAPGDSACRPAIVRLLRAVGEVLHDSFGSFLLLEVVGRPPTHEPLLVATASAPVPAFRVFAEGPQSEIYPLLEAVERHFGQMRLGGQRAAVEIVADARPFRQRPKPIFGQREAAELGCIQLSIEVEPVFRDAASQTIFPAVLRALRASFARSLHRAVYFFAERYTSHSPRNYHALGRRAMVKAVWEVDEKLGRIARSYDFLLLVTPVNGAEAWHRFRRGGFQEHPRFHYRPLPLDPSLAKRALYSVPIERVEDPTLAQLFIEKQADLDRQLTMLGDRDCERFLFGSLQLYGWIDQELLRAAEAVLERIPASRGHAHRATVKAEDFRQLALAEFRHYREKWDGFQPEIRVEQGLTSLMASKGSLLVPRELRLSPDRAEALLQHEVGTHLVTYYNGAAHRFAQLRSGLAGYEELQEGLATFMEYLAGGMTAARLRTLAARVCAAHVVAARGTFLDAFRLLCRYGFTQRAAFDITLRVFRSGGLTKDVIYFRGLRELIDYLREGGDLEALFIGKIALKHVPIVSELRSRGVLEPPRLLPRVLSRPHSRERLARARMGLQVHELDK